MATPFILVVTAPGSAPAGRRVTVSGPSVLGGSRADTVPVPGLPAAALRLLPCSAGLVLVPAVAGLRVGRHAVPPGTRRLLRPGERAGLQGVALAVAEAPPPEGTRVAVAALLQRAAAGAPGGPSLVAVGGPDAGARWALRGDDVVGRGRTSSVSLSDGQVSRRHARVRLVGARALLEDLGAKNGVRVNGVRVDRRRSAPLDRGDLITLGDTSLMVSGLGRPRLARRTLRPPERGPGSVRPPAAPAPAPGEARAPRRLRPGRLVLAGLLAGCAFALALAAS